VWDLWWTKWQWDGFFSEFFGFPCQYHSTVALHTHLPARWLLQLKDIISPYRKEQQASKHVNIIPLMAKSDQYTVDLINISVMKAQVS
jgi:hypothetical protein